MKYLLSTAWLAILPVVFSQHVDFPIQPHTSMAEAMSFCGGDAVVSCCKQAVYTPGIGPAIRGPLPGVVLNALDGGRGLQGVGLFEGCQDLSSNVMGVVDGLHQELNGKCQLTSACCPKIASATNEDGSAGPCVALGALQ